MKRQERRKLELQILLAEVEIRNIELILSLHRNSLTEKDVDGYLDRISAARSRIESLRARMNA